MPETLNLQTQSAYQELLQHFANRPRLEVKGAIFPTEKSGRTYWVARERAGKRVVETSLGPDSDETRQRVDALKAEQEVYKTWRQQAAQLVASLKAAKSLAPDAITGKTLAALSETGFFAAGGILGGTHAFRHYPLALGYASPREVMAQTSDIDVLATSSLKLSGGDASLFRRLKEAGLKIHLRFGMESSDAPKWLIDNKVELEILAPMTRGRENTYDHRGLGGDKVQAIRFLEFSLEDPMQAVSLYREGASVNVPAPERFAIHKLLVTQLRSGTFREKRNKDFAQAGWLIDILAEDRPFELATALHDAESRGPKWRKLLSNALLERPEIAERLEEIRDMAPARPR